MDTHTTCRAVRALLARTLVLTATMLSLSVTADTASLVLEDCRLEDAAGVRTVAARCGRVLVPENRADADGRKIGLFVAVIPALDPRPAEAALTVLAGGPGQAATEFYANYAQAFARVQRSRDILLVDQRGTGRSHPLDCTAPADYTAEWSAELVRNDAQRCLEELDADVRYYTTSVAVRDLDQVRAALGYPQLDLYGASYGTRVALHFLRRFPEHTRSVVLDGVVPPGLALGPAISLDAQNALELVFDRCDASPECAGQFPQLRAGFDALVHKLRDAPVALVLPDPLDAEPRTLEFRYSDFSSAVRLLSYSTESIALLPLLLREAYAHENYAPLAAQSIMATENLLQALSYGMHNAIVCTEDVPYYSDDIDREALASTYLGTLQLDTLIEICKIWPRGEIDPDLRQPLTSDHPVLILSGQADPITPPINGDRVAANLRNVLHVVGPGQGHGLAGLGCVPALLADFVDNPQPLGIDAACAARLAPAPFFTSFVGPEP